MVRASVVIPVFNGATTIARAVGSALGQRFDGKFEVIVVNDGSIDTTAEILDSYGTQIKVISQDNRGPAAARNAGTVISNGEYLVFLDADDAFTTNKLAATVPVLDRFTTAVLVFHDAIPVDTTGRQVAASYVSPEMARAPSMTDMLARWWPILPSTAVIRRKTFEACGGFVEEFRSAAYEDPYLWILAREHGEFQYVAKRLAYYTIEPPAARMAKYLRAQDIFIRRLNERYGNAASGLIRTTRHAYANALGYEGLVAMGSGDMAKARRHFIRALWHEPTDARTVLRLLRTFLPARLARMLSGRTGNGPESAPPRRR
jgi:glycosyltransferase involved in cell wall biosynthesis